MTKPNCTPGPWQINSYGGIGAGKWGTTPMIIAGNGWAHDWTPDERRRHYADRSLIIAARDLYEALEVLLADFEELARNSSPAVASVLDGLTTIRNARAALAKARGEDQTP